MDLKDKHVIIFGNAPGKTPLAEAISKTHGHSFVEASYQEVKRAVFTLIYKAPVPPTVLVIPPSAPPLWLSAFQSLRMVERGVIFLYLASKDTTTDREHALWVMRCLQQGSLTPGQNLLAASYDLFTDAAWMDVCKQLGLPSDATITTPG